MSEMEAPKTRSEQTEPLPLQSERRFSINPWILSITALVLLACIAYANSFDVPFAFDDTETIQGNPNVRLGAYSHWSELYPKPRSLTYASLAFNYWLGGQQVLGYHILNLLLHVLNGLLIF